MTVASWTAIVGPITTLLGVLGGYWLAGRNEDARDRRAAKREAESRQAALAERFEEKRHEVQLATLRELQDELLAVARSVMAALRAHERNMAETGSTKSLGGLAETIREQTASVQRLRSRVLDSTLRQNVDGYLELCSRVQLDDPEADSIEALRAELVDRQASLLDGYGSVCDELGEQLRRELDRGDLLHARGGTTARPAPRQSSCA